MGPSVNFRRKVPQLSWWSLAPHGPRQHEVTGVFRNVKSATIILHYGSGQREIPGRWHNWSDIVARPHRWMHHTEPVRVGTCILCPHVGRLPYEFGLKVLAMHENAVALIIWHGLSQDHNSIPFEEARRPKRVSSVARTSPHKFWMLCCHWNVIHWTATMRRTHCVTSATNWKLTIADAMPNTNYLHMDYRWHLMTIDDICGLKQNSTATTNNT